MMDGVVDWWVLLQDAYRMAAPELTAPAEGYARTAYRICVGEDETFDETYGQTESLSYSLQIRIRT